MVVVDPPAFASAAARGGKPWSAMRDYAELITAALDVIAPGGLLVAASSTHKMTADEFERALAEGAMAARHAAADHRSARAAARLPDGAGVPRGELPQVRRRRTRLIGTSLARRSHGRAIGGVGHRLERVDLVPHRREHASTSLVATSTAHASAIGGSAIAGSTRPSATSSTIRAIASASGEPCCSSRCAARRSCRRSSSGACWTSCVRELDRVDAHDAFVSPSGSAIASSTRVSFASASALRALRNSRNAIAVGSSIAGIVSIRSRA